MLQLPEELDARYKKCLKLVVGEKVLWPVRSFCGELLYLRVTKAILSNHLTYQRLYILYIYLNLRWQQRSQLASVLRRLRFS